MSLVLSQPTDPVVVTCHHEPCEEQVAKDSSHRFSVGISHYDLVTHQKSYIQVHQTMFCCTREHAKLAAHARIEAHKGFQFGVFDKSALNPVGDEFPDSLVQANAEYHPNPRYSPLPTVDCVTGQPLGSDVYLLHVDDSTRGTCYQEVLQKRDSSPKSLEYYDLATATLDNAVVAAHAILDEILDPGGEAYQVPAPGAGDTDPQLPAVKVTKKG